MNFEILKDHHSIGWDFDGTVCDHSRTKLMWNYIKSNPQKKHYIVTFRSGEQFYSKHGIVRWAEQGCWIDLLDCGSGLSEEHFVSIIHMSDREFEENCSKRTLSGLYTEPSSYYVEWKGKVCADHGITVLIDDNESHTKPGCDKYGITYVDPDILTGKKN